MSRKSARRIHERRHRQACRVAALTTDCSAGSLFDHVLRRIALHRDDLLPGVAARCRVPGVREDHRNDILQALAYSTLFDAPRVVSCLAYPAAPEHWSLLQQAGRTTARTRVPAQSREVELVLMSVPLSGRPSDECQDIERILQG